MCSRIGGQAASVARGQKQVRGGISAAGKQIQATHPQHLTASRPAPTEP